MTADNRHPRPPLRSLLFGGGTPRRAALIAAVVGTVLVAINHGDTLLQGGAIPWGKVALTYCVPYCVATWGALTEKRAALRRDGR